MDRTYVYGNVSKNMATSRGPPPYLCSDSVIAFYTFPESRQTKVMNTMKWKNIVSANGWLLSLGGGAEMDIENRFNVCRVEYIFSNVVKVSLSSVASRFLCL